SLLETRKSVTADAPEGHAVERRVRQRFVRGSREQDVTTLARPADPGGGVDGNPDVAGLADSGPAGVHPDPNADRDAARPAALPEPALDRECRLERADGFGEDREELVRSRVDPVAGGSTADGADDRPVGAEAVRLPDGETLEKLGR